MTPEDAERLGWTTNDLMQLVNNANLPEDDAKAARAMIYQLADGLRTLAPQLQRLQLKADAWDRVPMARLQAIAHRGRFEAGSNVIEVATRLAEWALDVQDLVKRLAAP